MIFKTLEEEFKYYANIFQWHIIFNAFKNDEKSKTLSMNQITTILVEAIASGTAAGVSGIVTAETIKNYKKIKEIVASEKFINFLTLITKNIQFSEELVIRNIRSFNGLRVALVFVEIYKILEKSNVEPKAIAEKILLPAIQSISEDQNIETDKDLQRKWANLLTKEILGQRVNPKFVRVLSELLPEEAKILDITHKKQNLGADKIASTKEIAEALLIGESEVCKKIELLQTENLCALCGSGDVTGQIPRVSSHKYLAVRLMVLGEQFMEVVSPLNTP